MKNKKIASLMLYASLLSSCGSENWPYNLETNSTLFEQISSLDFSTPFERYYSPITYDSLWGSEQNDFNNEQFSSILINFSQNNEKTYFIYVNSSFNRSIRTYWNNNKNKCSYDGLNPRFSSSYTDFDGKHLNAIFELGVDDVKFYETSNADAPYKIDNYTFAGALKYKTINILKNVSTNIKLDSSVTFFELIDYKKKFNRCVKANTSKDLLSGYEGDYLYLSTNRFFDFETFLFPFITFYWTSSNHLPNILCKVEDCKVLLPRYLLVNNTKIDLFNNDFKYLKSDIYKDKESFFKSIYIGDSTYSDSDFEFGWFDYQKLAEFIVNEKI